MGYGRLALCSAQADTELELYLNVTVEFPVEMFRQLVVVVVVTSGHVRRCSSRKSRLRRVKEGVYGPLAVSIIAGHAKERAALRQHCCCALSGR